MPQSGTEFIKHAKKKHLCSWCGNLINEGEAYARYRWYDGYDASTVKEHPECYDAMEEVISVEGRIEFSPGDYPRGSVEPN